MSLKTCKKRLELAKAKNDSKEIKFWEERIAHKYTLPKYAHLAPKVKELKLKKSQKR